MDGTVDKSGVCSQIARADQTRFIEPNHHAAGATVPIRARGNMERRGGRPGCRFNQPKGLRMEASRQRWDETLTQLQDWMIFNPAHLQEGKWDFMNDVRKHAERRHLALKRWLAATA